MKERGNGNIKPDKEEVQAFIEGDVVAINRSALRANSLNMTPKDLWKYGWPNEFLVRHTFETEEHGPCISLWPCCAMLVDRETNKLRCKGHPSVYFEKIDYQRPPKKGDKGTSIILPILGEIIGLEYHEDENNPEFIARIAGQGGKIQGVWAKLLKNLAEQGGII